jgi:hypothetical protein
LHGAAGGRVYPARQGIDHRLAGQDNGRPRFARRGFDQTTDYLAGHLVQLLDNAHIADGQQADFVPVVVVNVPSQRLDHALDIALATLGNGHRGQVFLKSQVDKTIFSGPAFQQQPGVMAGVVQQLAGGLLWLG